MEVTYGPAGTIIITGAEGWREPMRLILTTKHRKIVIATGDDVATEDDDAETYISNTSAQLDVAPDYEDGYDEDEEESRFGFRPQR